ncbi:hypothetical protein GQ42DRAFT_120719 [Ramicandelaber brevisporus]|nr:hypothetical protein GQ42DRAFT_120719 [Ramicandelaber brevisporus]
MTILSRVFGTSFKPTLILENKGSVARDNLANERTFLAWVRTSLALTTVGVAIVQLFRYSPLPSSPIHPQSASYTSGAPIGAAFIFLGLVLLLFGMIRYFYTQKLMNMGQFPASRLIIFVSATGIAFLMVALLAIMFISAS